MADQYAKRARWAAGPRLQRGSVFTITGVYQRRTLWQWLTRKPRALAQWIVR